MLEANGETPKKAVDSAVADDRGDTGFKGFNRTGREDTTREIIRPTLNTATRMRYAVMIAFVVLLLGVVGYLAYGRSHLDFSAPKDDVKQFAPGQQQSPE